MLCHPGALLRKVLSWPQEYTSCSMPKPGALCQLQHARAPCTYLMDVPRCTTGVCQRPCLGRLCSGLMLNPAARCCVQQALEPLRSEPGYSHACCTCCCASTSGSRSTAELHRGTCKHPIYHQGPSAAKDQAVCQQRLQRLTSPHGCMECKKSRSEPLWLPRGALLAPAREEPEGPSIRQPSVRVIVELHGGGGACW